MEKLFTEMMTRVISSLIHNWIPLSIAILVAAMMTVYIDQEKLKQALLRRTHISIWASVAFGAFTPLCACGTMAVIIGMLTTTLPWGPIMAFLTSSPLISPDGFIMLAGMISLKFAIALTFASIVIGLGSGYLTQLIEKKTDFLINQTRFEKKLRVQTCGCSATTPFAKQRFHNQTCNCADEIPVAKKVDFNTQVQLCCADQSGTTISLSPWNLAFGQLLTIWHSAHGQLPTVNINLNFLSRFLLRIKWRALAEALLNIGVKQILLFYSVFVAIGFLINHFLPASLIMTLFSGKNAFAVPLAALIGLPIYVSGEGAIPLIQAFMTAGAGGGAMLAFMITGPGTSAWVIAGIVSFMKKRVISLYVLFILMGGILLGYLCDLLLALGI